MRLKYRKITGDIKSDYAKSILLVLSIAIGVFAIGMILGGYAVLKREMARNYLGTNPASATIELAESTVSPALAAWVRTLPHVVAAERHATISARMKIDGDWRRLLLFVVDDFARKETNKVRPVSGAAVPETGRMLVERTSLPVMRSGLGDTLVIQTPQGGERRILISGLVHDPSLAPSRQEQTGYGYITLETLHALGETQGFNELRIVFAEPDLTHDESKTQARQIASKLVKHGYGVSEIQVPPPRRHPHQGQSQAILSLFVLFAFLILFLSSVLVATSISTLMVRQVREIGVMKSIGADSRQIAEMYMLMILLFCIVAVAVAVPLSRIAAADFYSQIAHLLNLEIFDGSIPLWVVLVQLISGLLIPLAVALFPVLGGSRVSVREAMDNRGFGTRNPGRGVFEKLLPRLKFLSGSMQMSIRNLFRRRGQLIMTLMLLGTGGAIFMSALNISEAWDANLGKIYKYRRYDMEIRLNSPIEPNRALELVSKIPGIKSVEAWGVDSTAFMQENAFKVSATYPDQGHGSFIMLATPPRTGLLDLPITAGRWLENAAADEVVLNQIARAMRPGIQIGDTVALELHGTTGNWKVVGFVEDVGSPATAFVPCHAFAARHPMEGRSNMLRIAFTDRSPENARIMSRRIEARLARENISVNQSVPVAVLHNAMAEHMGVLKNALLALSILMGAVGALGLMSAMSVNVFERTREFGVLRAMGATPGKIRSLVLGEGLMAGIGSTWVSFGLSLPISIYIGRLVGDTAFRTPLSLVISPLGLKLWLAIIVFASIAATLYPAQRAVRITIREALSYE